jgi:hypothetical protein
MKYGRLLGVLSVAAGLACREHLPPGGDANAARKQIVQLGACLDTSGEEQALACAPPTVRRDNHTLTIRLKNGETLKYVDDSVGEVMAGTMFRGTIIDLPVFSPDSTRYAASDPEWSDCELGSGTWAMVDPPPRPRHQ